MQLIMRELPNHPVSIMHLCVKHSENSDEITMASVRAALLYLNEDGEIYFDEVNNVLRKP
jgi:hypothetical protein